MFYHLEQPHTQSRFLFPLVFFLHLLLLLPIQMLLGIMMSMWCSSWTWCVHVHVFVIICRSVTTRWQQCSTRACRGQQFYQSAVPRLSKSFLRLSSFSAQPKTEESQFVWTDACVCHSEGSEKEWFGRPWKGNSRYTMKPSHVVYVMFLCSWSDVTTCAPSVANEGVFLYRLMSRSRSCSRLTSDLLCAQP